MTQFSKLYTELFTQGCKPTEAVMLSMIFDRMQSSKQRISFYSQNKKDYFVIYTYQELSQNLNISCATAKRVFKQAIIDGYITTELKDNRVNLIYLTDKSKAIVNAVEPTAPVPAGQNEPQGGQNEPLIRLNKHTNKTSITDITESSTQSKKEIHNQQQINALMNTLITQVKLPKRTVHYLKELAFNDPSLMYHYVGLLLKAKHCVKCATKRFKYSNASCLMFDDNTDLSECLNNNVYGILIKANKHGRNRDRYIMGSFVNMFKEYYNQVNTGRCEDECTTVKI